MNDIINALEICLEGLETGAGLEDVLAGFPDYVKDLRPLLETATAARDLRYNRNVPQSAQSKCRDRFLKRCTP
jgi:hypothetical protein